MNDPSQPRPLNESKDRAVDAAQNAANKVRDVAEDRAEEARSIAEDKLTQARDIAQAKIAEARDMAESKVDEAHQTANEGVSNAAHGLKNTADRLRGVADELDGQDRWLGATLERAASTADRAGDYLSGQKLGDIVDDAQHLARRNPATFMGGAAALGFALARLGKVTVDRATRDSGYSGPTSGVHRSQTYAASDANRTTTHASASAYAPTPGGLNTGTTSPLGAAARPVTRPTDGRDLHPDQATPLHRSQT